MRGGFLSSFSVPGAGMLTRVDPNGPAGYGDGKGDVEEACCYARENEKSRESMEVGHTHPPGNGGNLGVMPFDRESEWSAPEHAEVIRIMGIFPDVLTGED